MPIPTPTKIEEAIALIKALGPTFAALAAFGSSLVNRRGIRKLRVEVNSRLTELLKLRAEASHAEGRREGIESTIPKPDDK